MPLAITYLRSDERLSLALDSPYFYSKIWMLHNKEICRFKGDQQRGRLSESTNSTQTKIHS